MKMNYRITVRIPGRLQYSFIEVQNVEVEVDIPDHQVVGYPNSRETYLTPKGLRHLDEVLTTAVREETSVQVDEEGW